MYAFPVPSSLRRLSLLLSAFANVVGMNNLGLSPPLRDENAIINRFRVFDSGSGTNIAPAGEIPHVNWRVSTGQ